jgi:hypothetical protein
MSDTTPTLGEFVERAIELGIEDLNVCVPAEVVSFDGSRARVKPGISKKFGESEYVEMPEIDSVRVATLSGGGAIISLPVSKGTTGFLLFCDRQIDAWLNTGKTSEPTDPRTHALSDAIFVPMLQTFSEEIDKNDVVIAFGQSEFRIAKNGTMSMKTSGGELSISSSGKLVFDGLQVVLGGQAAEVVDILLSTLQSLGRAVTPLAPAGTAPLSEVASFVQLAARLQTIKGSK